MVNIFYLPGCWSEEELGCLSVVSSPPSCPDCWWPDKCSWQSPPPPHWEWSGSTSCCHWSGCSPSSCPASCCSWTRPSLGQAQHELCRTSPAAHQHLPPPSAGLGGCGADTAHEGWSEINIFLAFDWDPSSVLSFQYFTFRNKKNSFLFLYWCPNSLHYFLYLPDWWQVVPPHW